MGLNVVDFAIILFLLASVGRGLRIGLVRQAGSSAGFVAGLFVGSWVSNLVVGHIQGSINKSLASLAFVLLGGFIFMTLGEVAGLRLKQHLIARPSVDRLDRGFGSLMAIATMLFAIWLGASILVLGPVSGFQQSLKHSHILSTLNTNLPPATKLLSSLNKLVDPNGFPQVFRGLEPNPGNTPVPSIGSLDPVVAAARASVVKVEGTGCGGIVEGSGFVFAADHIATNAHVVAGVAAPKVIDQNGIHDTRVVWFDPGVDLAILQVSQLAGKPLSLVASDQAAGTPGVVLGYPGGGDFNAQPAAVIDHFTAYGRDIYGQGTTTRDVYSLRAKVIPGNSGGPVVGADGRVLGIIFATSTTYDTVGYALTGHQVASELSQAATATKRVGTGSCSE